MEAISIIGVCLLLFVQALVIIADEDATVYTKCGGDVPPEVKTITYPTVRIYPKRALCRWLISRPSMFKISISKMSIDDGWSYKPCDNAYLRIGSSKTYCTQYRTPPEEILADGRLAIYFYSVRGVGRFSLNITDCWEKISPGCARSSNIKRFQDKSLRECQALCLNTDCCVGIEYGVDHGGPRRHYKARDCQLNNSTDSQGCDGLHNNLDFYAYKCSKRTRSVISSMGRPEIGVQIKRVNTGTLIPYGWRLLRKSEVQKYESKVKSKIEYWAIVKLASGWIYLGKGYGYKLKKYNYPQIKEQIVIKEFDDPKVFTRCGGLVPTGVKTIKYPAIGKYTDAVDCTWIIDRPGETFQLVIVDFSLKGDCKKNSLQFGYGPKYCNHQRHTPLTQNSTDGALQFFLHSTGPGEKGGFTFQIKSLTDNSEDNPVIVSATEAPQATTTTTIATAPTPKPRPGWMPYLKLHSGRDIPKGWRLVTKAEAEQYALKLRKFGEGYWIANIAGGLHFVRSGYYGWSHHIQHGANETAEKSLLLREVTDPYVYDECGGVVPSTVRIIRYPYNNENYVQELKCTWIIRRPEKNFQLRFKMIDIPKYGWSKCSYEKLSFSGYKHTFCGEKLPKPIAFRDGHLEMTFVSSYFQGGKGFELEIVSSKDLEKEASESAQGKKEFQILKSHEKIPGGWRIASKEDVRSHLPLVKKLLHKYSLVSLKNNWSVSGWGRGYQIEHSLQENIPKKLIIKEFEDSSEYFECGGTVPSHATTIGYPQFGKYSPSVTCTWNITRPYDFRLKFIRMDFPNDQCTNRDYIQVKDSPFFCAKVLPPNLYSQGGSLHLKFASNSDADLGEGFAAKIERVDDAKAAAVGRLSHSFPKLINSGFLSYDRTYSYYDNGDYDESNYPAEVQITRDAEGRFYKVDKYWYTKGKVLIVPDGSGKYIKYTKKKYAKGCITEKNTIPSSPPLFERNLERWRLKIESWDDQTIVQRWHINHYWDDDPFQYDVGSEHTTLRLSISTSTGVAVPLESVYSADMLDDDGPAVRKKSYSYQPGISDESVFDVSKFCGNQ